MINDGINNVPDKTIAIFVEKNYKDLSEKKILNIVKKPNKKRSWFTPHFYRCLPLTVGNQYGFTVALEFDVGMEWNGGTEIHDTKLYFPENISEDMYPNISTHFGHGIVTINTPFFFRTPPGINLMTISPPNFIIPNITHMTGVVETDNLRRNFTFNLKIQIPNIRTLIPAGAPIAAFMPIPRYFADDFKLEMASNIFSQELIDEELKANSDAIEYRKNIEPTLKNNVGKHYFKGTDVYGNKFPDHQNP